MNNDLFKLHHDALVELYKLDLNPIGVNVVQHFVDSTLTNGNPVIWRSQTYVAYPITSSGFEKTRSGPPANPQLQLSNVSSIISALTRAYKGLLGAKIERYTIFAYNLDNAPNPNPLEVQDHQVWYISRYSKNELVGTFSLRHSLELTAVKVPRRRISALIE
ncbi:hypothetical protein LEP3755_34210 [Leptolyngbya sp. NIES-3755]|nr:hypothetical protein LEP3755_34210 [Leptolyngbya sp. NIES-3755]